MPSFLTSNWWWIALAAALVCCCCLVVLVFLLVRRRRRRQAAPEPAAGTPMSAIDYYSGAEFQSARPGEATSVRSVQPYLPPRSSEYGGVGGAAFSPYAQPQSPYASTSGINPSSINYGASELSQSITYDRTMPNPSVHYGIAQSQSINYDRTMPTVNYGIAAQSQSITYDSTMPNVNSM